MSADLKEIEVLTADLVDGNLNDEQKTRLDQLLQESEEAREYYNDYIDNHIALDWHFASNSLDLPSGLEPLIEEKKTQSVIPFIITGIAAAAAIITLIFLLPDKTPEIKTVDKAAEKNIYTLDKSISATWHEPIEKGHRFSKGKLEIKEGYGELTSDNGVKLIIEGPAELELLSKNEIKLNKGKIVSRTSGEFLNIQTPKTKFKTSRETAVEVKNNGDTEILALAGEIDTGGEKIRESESRLFTAKGSLLSKADSRDFMRVLPDKAEDLKHIHWAFNEGSGPVTHYNGENLKDRDYDAYFRSTFKGKPGPQWVQGKFGSAVKFDGNGGFLETGFPGIGGSSARTVSFWVKVPEDAGLHQSKLVSWGSYEGKGHTWQISWNWVKVNGKIGAIRAGIYHGQIVGTKDLRDNQWHHVSVVMFGGEQANVSTHILLYVDGKLEKTSKKSILGVKTDIKSKKAVKVLMGRDAMGYTLKNKPENVFRGWMDEVYIFNSALSESQIREIMNKNSPPSGQ